MANRPLDQAAGYNPRVAAPKAPDLGAEARAQLQVGKAVTAAATQIGGAVQSRLDQNEYARQLAEANVEINAATQRRLSGTGEPVPHDVFEEQMRSIVARHAENVPRKFRAQYDTAMANTTGEQVTRSYEHEVALQDRRYAQFVDGYINQELGEIQERPYDAIGIADRISRAVIDPMPADDVKKAEHRLAIKSRALQLAVDAAIERNDQSVDDLRAELEDPQRINGSLNEEQRLSLLRKLDTAGQSFTMASLDTVNTALSVAQDTIKMDQDATEVFETVRADLTNAQIQYDKNKHLLTESQRRSWEKSSEKASAQLEALESVQRNIKTFPQMRNEDILREIDAVSKKRQEAVARGDFKRARVEMSKEQAMRQAFTDFNEMREDGLQMAVMFDAATKRAYQEMVTSGDPIIKADKQQEVIEASLAYQRKIGIEKPRMVSNSERSLFQNALKSNNTDSLMALTSDLRTRYRDNYSAVMQEILPSNASAAMALSSDEDISIQYIEGRKNYDANVDRLIANKSVSAEKDLSDQLRDVVSDSGIGECFHKDDAVVELDVINAALPIYAQNLVMNKPEPESAALEVAFRDMQYGHKMAINVSTRVTPDMVNDIVTPQWSRMFLEASIGHQGSKILSLSGSAREEYLDSPVYFQTVGDGTKAQPYTVDPSGVARNYIKDPQGKRLKIDYSMFSAPTVLEHTFKGVVGTEHDAFAQSLDTAIASYGYGVDYEDRELTQTEQIENIIVSDEILQQSMRTERTYKLKDREINILEDFE